MSSRLIAAVLLLGGCANAPAAIQRMDAVVVRDVPNGHICYAVALARQTRKPNPPAETEQRRRGLGCEAEIAENVSDCAALKILNPGTAFQPDENVPYEERTPTTDDVGHYKVQNTGEVAMTFRLTWSTRITPRYRLGPKETGTFMILVPAAAGRELHVARRKGGRPLSPLLQDCMVGPGSGGVRGAKVPW